MHAKMEPLSMRVIIIAVLGTGQTLVDGVKNGGGYSGWCAAKAEGTVGLVLNTRVAKGAVSFADEVVKFADRRVDQLTVGEGGAQPLHEPDRAREDPSGFRSEANRSVLLGTSGARHQDGFRHGHCSSPDHTLAPTP